MDLWDASQWIEYIRTLSTKERNRTGHDLEHAEQMLVLAMLWVLPFFHRGGSGRSPLLEQVRY